MRANESQRNSMFERIDMQNRQESAKLREDANMLRQKIEDVDTRKIDYERERDLLAAEYESLKKTLLKDKEMIERKAAEDVKEAKRERDDARKQQDRCQHEAREAKAECDRKIHIAEDVKKEAQRSMDNGLKRIHAAEEAENVAKVIMSCFSLIIVTDAVVNCRLKCWH